MIRNLALTLAMTVVVALAANQVMARGGGHGGGGHHGGGHHGGGHHGGHNAGHHNSHHHSGHHHHAHHGHHDHPFSHHGWGHRGWGWGGGWGGGGWGGGWGNAWAPATLGAAAGWLGAEALGSNDGGYAPIDTVYTSDDGSADDDSDDADPTAQADDDNNDTAEANENEAAQPQAAPISTEAAALAKSGVVDPPKDAKLLPLGVYSIAPQGHTEASAMLQLAITKDGILRGSYYDLLSNEDHQVQGAVDKKTQRVAWTIGPKGKVLFETSLANLTQDKGPLSVHYEDGESRPWTIARYATEAAAKEAGEKAEAAANEQPPSEAKTGKTSK